MLNVLVVCDGDDSSGTYVMRDLARYSRHHLQIVNWTREHEFRDENDVVYFYYGGLLHNTGWSEHGQLLINFMRHHRNVKWIAGIRGNTNLKRWTNEMRPNSWEPTSFCDFVYELDAISVANTTIASICREAGVDNVHVCHSGVDTQRFAYRPLPSHFSIGWAGLASTGAKDVGSFLRLPFPKRTAAVGYGTYIPFEEMHTFYPKISVYVSTSVEEGSAVPPKEAASCGRPVVAFITGDFEEWIPPEYLMERTRCGYKALVPLIARLRDDPDLLQRESKRFRGLAENLWDYAIVAREYDRLFESVL
jgi:glycosyltransferase involved in cell wall biosynthesis